jgi:hypothetical protein
MLNDRLRKINGKIMYYSKEYYAAIQQKTKIVANILNKFDTLGAIINKDILQQYATLGRIDPPKEFLNIYQEIFSYPNIKKAFLLDRDKLISEHFTKFMNSQQRMFKYLYKFKEYFNSRSDFTHINQNKKLTFKTPVLESGKTIYSLGFSDYN